MTDYIPIPKSMRDHKVLCAQWMLDHMIAQGCDPHCHVCGVAYFVGDELGWTRGPDEFRTKNDGEFSNLFVVHYRCRGKPWTEKVTVKEVDTWRQVREKGSVPQGGIMREPAKSGASFLSFDEFMSREEK